MKRRGSTKVAAELAAEVAQQDGVSGVKIAESMFAAMLGPIAIAVRAAVVSLPVWDVRHWPTRKG